MDTNLPFCDLGNLDGPDGNAFFIMAKTQTVLKSNGFPLEAGELSEIIMHYGKINYEENFNKIRKFLDISNKVEVEDEDEDYVYVRIKKSKKHRAQATNGCETNIYGRSKAFYLSSGYKSKITLESLSYDEIFCKDSFGATPLTVIKEPTILFGLIKRMFELDAEKTKEIIGSCDIWGRGLATNVLSIFHEAITNFKKGNGTKERALKDIYTIKEMVTEILSFTAFWGLDKQAVNMKPLSSNQTALLLFSKDGLDMVGDEFVKSYPNILQDPKIKALLSTLEVKVALEGKISNNINRKTNKF